MKNVIILCGAQGTGKSSLARQILAIADDVTTVFEDFNPNNLAEVQYLRQLVGHHTLIVCTTFHRDAWPDGTRDLLGLAYIYTLTNGTST